MQAYSSEFDEDIKDLQRADLAPRQRLAAQVWAGRVGASQLEPPSVLPGTSCL